MIFQPIVYFSVITGSDGVETVFGQYDSTSDDNFACLYTFGDISPEHNNILIIWYDLETQSFYRFSHLIENSEAVKAVFAMLVAQGAICLWLCENDRTDTIREFNCERIELEALSDDWAQMRDAIQMKYNQQRRTLSVESGRFYNTIRILMRRFCYRYCPTVTGNKGIDLQCISETLSDGTIRRIKDNEFFQYYYAAKPKKLSLTWSIDNAAYCAYYWMDEEQMTGIFEKFYGAHPDTKSDFIISIDAENQKYDLALYRQGMKEPLVIPKSAYQLIVFKNKFEDYRSENYNQPRGAWIW